MVSTITSFADQLTPAAQAGMTVGQFLSERFKIKLQDRSYRAGVWRAGETMSELLKDRKKPPEDGQWVEYIVD